MGILENYRITSGGYTLIVDRLYTKNTHTFDRGARKSFPSIVYVTGGVFEIRAIGGWLTAKAGDLVFLPAELRYHSCWTGNPEISHYCLHLSSETGLNVPNSDVPLQRIDALSIPETGERMAEIFRLASLMTTVTDLRALSRFFELYADVQTHLRHEPPAKYHSALFAAMKYIEENFTRNFTMHELEEATFVGESRLYHLFQTQLKTTPLKFRNQLRIERAAELLITSELSIEDVAAEAGFSSFGYFRQSFKAHTGLTPFEFRRNRRHIPEKSE